MDEYQIPEPEAPASPKPKRKRSRWLLPVIVLASILMVFLVMLGYVAVILVRDSGVRGAADKLNLVGQCEIKLNTIGAALDRYNISQGHYPPTLESLYPDYLPSRSALRCPADITDPKSMPTSYSYKQPKSGDPDDTIVCVCRHHQILKEQPLELRLLKNGKTESAAAESR